MRNSMIKKIIFVGLLFAAGSLTASAQTASEQPAPAAPKSEASRTVVTVSSGEAHLPSEAPAQAATVTEEKGRAVQSTGVLPSALPTQEGRVSVEQSPSHTSVGKGEEAIISTPKAEQ